MPNLRGVEASAKREAPAQILDMLQSWQTLAQVKVSEKEIKKKKWGKRNWQWLREGLEPATWQMACHALTNWATESLSNSVADLRLSMFYVSGGGAGGGRGLSPPTLQLSKVGGYTFHFGTSMMSHIKLLY